MLLRLIIWRIIKSRLHVKGSRTVYTYSHVSFFIVLNSNPVDFHPLCNMFCAKAFYIEGWVSKSSCLGRLWGVNLNAWLKIKSLEMHSLLFTTLTSKTRQNEVFHALLAMDIQIALLPPPPWKQVFSCLNFGVVDRRSEIMYRRLVCSHLHRDI